MAFLEKKLGQRKLTTTGTITVYTCPASTVGICKAIWMVNNLTSASTISIHHVSAGGSILDDNRLVPETSIPGSDFIHAWTFVVMSASDTIQVTSDTISPILTVKLYGAEVT